MILVYGGGEIGRAVGHVLDAQNKAYVVFDIVSEKSDVGEGELGRVCQEANIIFVCVPSSAADAVFAFISETYSIGSVVAVLTKGIPPSRIGLMDVLCANAFSDDGVLFYGPMLAEEIMKGERGYAVCAGAKPATDSIKDCFKGSLLTVDTTTDIKGVALCGVLKNMYAFGLGILAGKEVGNNMRSAAVVRAFSEMKMAVREYGGKIETVEGFAGLGDMLATGSSEYSHNFSLGKEYALRKAHTGKSEALRSAEALSKIISIDNLPLLESIYRVIVAGAEADVIVESL